MNKRLTLPGGAEAFLRTVHSKQMMCSKKQSHADMVIITCRDRRPSIFLRRELESSVS